MSASPASGRCAWSESDPLLRAHHELCWSFTEGETLRGDGVHVPTNTELSERVSNELKRRGFKFVGPTIVYAWMQAVGIVNDHALGCFRRDQI